jgi:hypothetical protein
MFNAAEKLWMKTGNLLVLTINVNAEVVVQDAEADQELLEPDQNEYWIPNRTIRGAGISTICP